MTNDMMVEFRLRRSMSRLPSQQEPGERVLMRVSGMLCLFPDHCQIRTIETGWLVDVCPEDWPKVERAFRFAFLGGKVHAADIGMEANK